MRQSRETFSSRSQAPSECFCEHFHPAPRDMSLHRPLTSLPLKRKRAARGTGAPRAQSRLGWFFLLPELPSVAGSVAPPDCLLVRAAARAPRTVLGASAPSGNKLATIPGEPTGAGCAGLWPRCDVLTQLLHGGRSGSPVQ